MIYFRELNSDGIPLDPNKFHSAETEEEILNFFQFWMNHPLKKRFFVSGRHVVFEYGSGILDGYHLNVAWIERR